MPESLRHPCQSCGACCAFFRVEFNTSENLPSEFCEGAAPGKQIMRGTGAKHKPSCVALLGRVGQRVTCGIYEQRSSTCRKFAASYENGQKNPRCDEARARHGLAPLSKEHWREYVAAQSTALGL